MNKILFKKLDDSAAQLELRAFGSPWAAHDATHQVLKDQSSRGKRYLRELINKDRYYKIPEGYKPRNNWEEEESEMTSQEK